MQLTGIIFFLVNVDVVLAKFFWSCRDKITSTYVGLINNFQRWLPLIGLTGRRTYLNSMFDFTKVFIIHNQYLIAVSVCWNLISAELSHFCDRLMGFYLGGMVTQPVKVPIRRPKLDLISDKIILRDLVISVLRFIFVFN